MNRHRRAVARSVLFCKDSELTSRKGVCIVKLIVLGAGYATRLYPLTLNQPKPLLPVAGKPMLEHVLDKLKPIASIDHVYIVTNAKFTEHFQRWAEHFGNQYPPLTIINDQSTDNSN